MPFQLDRRSASRSRLSSETRRRKFPSFSACDLKLLLLLENVLLNDAEPEALLEPLELASGGHELGRGALGEASGRDAAAAAAAVAEAGEAQGELASRSMLGLGLGLAACELRREPARDVDGWKAVRFVRADA